MTIPEHAVQTLRQIAVDFREQTLPYFPKRDAWKILDNDGIWKNFVYQVAVVGSSASYDRLVGSPDVQRVLHFDRLRTLSVDERRRTINEELRRYGVRYASADLSKCKKTTALLRNLQFLSTYEGGPTDYMKFIAALPDDDSKIGQIESDMSYVKLKGARDLLAELGLVTDIIALDIRILTILRRLGPFIPDEIQTNHSQYVSLQKQILERVCKPLGTTGVELDRILYRNYDAILATLR